MQGITINMMQIYIYIIYIFQGSLPFYFAGKSKEAEVKRINKELANIRSKFKGKAFS